MSKVGLAICLGPKAEVELIEEVKNTRLPLSIVRRCVDTTEVLSVAKAKAVAAIVLDEDYIDVDQELLDELDATEVMVFVLGYEDTLGRLEPPPSARFILREAVSATVDKVLLDSDAVRVMEALNTMFIPAEAGGSNGLLWPIEALRAVGGPPPPPVFPVVENQKNGKIIVLWGTPGAPGRTTVAINLASHLAKRGQVLLIDGDTQSPALDIALGLPPGPSGIAQAMSMANRGVLSALSILQIITHVGKSVDLLTGLSRAERWEEITRSGITTTLRAAKGAYDWVVVDLGSGIDPVDADIYSGPTRFQATAMALVLADLLVIVGGADPVGVRRLVALLHSPEAKELPDNKIIVVNRVRRSINGIGLATSLHSLLYEHIPKVPVHYLPDAQVLCDKALLASCEVASIDANSALAQAFDQLATSAGHVLGVHWREKRRRVKKKRRFWSRT